jgi:hypothetical protein
MQKIQQEKLISQFTKCEEIKPCDYHLGRSKTKLFEINEENAIIFRNNHSAFLNHNSKDIKKIARMLIKDEEPAGGWCLVKEQREWLKERVSEKIDEVKRDGRKEFNVLEAGVASYIHHYLYQKLITECLREKGCLGNENLIKTIIHIIDICKYPIEQIKKIEIALSDGLAEQKWLTIVDGVEPILLSYDFLDIIDSKSRYFSEISLNPLDFDLSDPAVKTKINKVDIITDHYLFSFIDNAKITDVIDNYSFLLKENGYLLQIYGVIEGTPRYDEYVNLFTSRGFEKIGTKTKAFIWDLYDIDKEQIKRITNYSDDIPITLENTLFAFRKIG